MPDIVIEENFDVIEGNFDLTTCEQWIITGITFLDTTMTIDAEGIGAETFEREHANRVNDAIEAINNNPDGIGVVIDVSTPVVQYQQIAGVLFLSAWTQISFGVPASVYALLPGERAKYLSEDFDDSSPD